MRMTRRDIGLGALACLVPGTLRAEVDPIADLVAQVDAARLRDTVYGLAAFPTRWTDHADFGAVEDWVAEAFLAQGADPALVTRQAFTMPSGNLRHNIVVGDLSDPRVMIVVGGHMDSTSETPLTLAPGANDDASGVAAILEAHRILSGLTLPRQVVFMVFAGEEQGLYGSAHAAGSAAQARLPIGLMLNLDMLGYRPPNPSDPMVIEYDQGNARPGNDAIARVFGERAAGLAATHTTLATTFTDIWDSDYMPFEAQGFPCIGLYDGGAEGSEYHTTGDTPDRVDFRRLEQAARLTVAILADLAGAAE